MHFDNKDENYSFLPTCKFRLSRLAELHWSKLFERESLSVFFVTENEMKDYDTPDHLDDLNSTDYMGLYFSYHDKYGSDVVFICPDRIKQVSKKRKIDFEHLLNKVFVHELAHSLMQQNVFSVSETALYDIPSFKFFEESLCNAFALLHFSGNEKNLLTEFCKSQSPGYRHFFIWDESDLFSSMNKFKSFKGDNHFLLNYLWGAQNKDALLDDRSYILNNHLGGEAFYFESVNIIDGDKFFYSEAEKTKALINNIFKIKGLKLLDFDVIKKSRDIVWATANQMGFETYNNGQNVFLQYKLESVFVHFFCLNKNNFSVFVVERELLDKLIDYPFHCLTHSRKSVVENSEPIMSGGQKHINSSQLKVGMTIMEVLNIVGENNLIEAAEYFKSTFPGSEKIMTFRSGGCPTGCVLGFKDEMVDRIVKFSTSD